MSPAWRTALRRGGIPIVLGIVCLVAAVPAIEDLDPLLRGLGAILVVLGLIIVVATVGKFGGTLLAGRLTGLGWQDAAALGVLATMWRIRLFEECVGQLKRAVADAMCEACVEAIQKTAFTGRIGDGKIFVFDLLQVVRIRTGEVGAEAL